MTSDPRFPAPGPLGPDQQQTDTIDLLAPLLVLWAHRWLMAAVTAGVVALAVLAALRMPPEFRATAQVTIGGTSQSYTDIGGVADRPEADETSLAGEIGLILSNETMLAVIEGLRLDQDADYNPFYDDGQPGTADRIAALFGRDPDPAPVVEPFGSVALDRTIGSLRRSLTVEPMGRSLILNISATASGPRKAALIANAVANTYIRSKYSDMAAEGARARDWYSERLAEMRTQITASERKAEAYRASQLAEFGESVETGSARLQEIGRQLALAQRERALQEARYASVSDAGGDRARLAALPEVLRSEVVVSQRERIALLSAEEANLLTRYGANHPEVRAVRAELVDRRASLDAEIDVIVAGITRDTERARDTETRLQTQIRELELRMVRQDQSTSELRALQEDVSISREVYLDVLSRYRKVSEATTLVRPEARLVSDALPPQSSSGTSKKLLVALALFLGVGLGAMAALLREATSQTIQTGEQAERLSALPHLGSLPLVRDARWARAPLAAQGHQPRNYQEGIRSLAATLRRQIRGQSGVIGLTSAEPEAGQAATVAALAEELARGGRRTLLIDCGGARPDIARLVLGEDGLRGLTSLSGLLAPGAGGAPAQSAVVQSAFGFDLVSLAGPEEMAAGLHDMDAIGSALAQLRKEYEVVLVALPPVLAASDVLYLMPHLDVTLMLIRWNATGRTTIRSALRKLGGLRDGLGGLVLIGVDARRAPREEAVRLA